MILRGVYGVMGPPPPHHAHNCVCSGDEQKHGCVHIIIYFNGNANVLYIKFAYISIKKMHQEYFLT